MGLKAGKRILTSDLAKQVGSTALDIGKSTLKNVAADLIEGKDTHDTLNKGLESAKATIANQIRGSGRKRKRKHCATNNCNCEGEIEFKRGKQFNLLE